MPFFARTESPLGTLLMVSDGRALAGVYFVGQKYQAQPALDWHEDPELPVLKRAGVQLHEYFGGRRHEFDLPLSPAGTQFQQRVWRALRSIPYGVTRSYGALAQSIGAPRSVRAVGAAIGRNPISIVIPCHRVVGGDGSLTGYAGGLARKQALLDLETAQVRNRRGGSRTTETGFSTAQT